MPLTVRLGLFYGAIFIGTGVSSPYLPVWFAHHGLSGSRIGLILSLPMLARAFTAPLLAVWADSFRLRRTALILMSRGGDRGSTPLMALPCGFAWWAVVWFAASSMYSTLSPAGRRDRAARAPRRTASTSAGRGASARPAFIVGNVGMGAILTRGSPELVLVWMVAAAALASAGRALPAAARPGA